MVLSRYTGLALFGALALGLTTAGGAPAQAKSCADRAVSAPDIRINVAFQGPVLRTNVSRKKLQQERGGPAHPMGLTRVSYNQRMEFAVSFQPLPGGQGGCYEATAVKVDIGTSPVTVYLASELKPSSCAYKVTLAHENRHVDNARGAMQRHTQRLRDVIRAALPGRMQPAKSAEDGARRLKEALRPVLTGVLDAITADARALDAAMDTPEAYAAESRKCGDWPV